MLSLVTYALLENVARYLCSLLVLCSLLMLYLGFTSFTYALLMLYLCCTSHALAALLMLCFVKCAVPSRNDKHTLEECYAKDDAHCSALLTKCYTALLDSFFQLARIK